MASLKIIEQIPRALAANMTVECSVCLEETISGAAEIDDSVACHSCVRNIFESAIENEDSYPPRWGATLLQPAMFRSIIPPSVVKAYYDKESEYLTPPNERIYCTKKVPKFTRLQPCNTFLGKIEPLGANEWILCMTCEGVHCSLCGAAVLNDEHNCELSHAERDAFEGMVRGRDYQICPCDACKRKVELIDGCNHMKCKCGQDFCFICGKATRDSDHWGRRADGLGCPRWNQPDAPNAQWDVDDVQPANVVNQPPAQPVVQNPRDMIPRVFW